MREMHKSTVTMTARGFAAVAVALPPPPPKKASSATRIKFVEPAKSVICARGPNRRARGTCGSPHRVVDKSGLRRSAHLVELQAVRDGEARQLESHGYEGCHAQIVIVARQDRERRGHLMCDVVPRCEEHDGAMSESTDVQYVGGRISSRAR